jgi:hypothetical protein
MFKKKREQIQNSERGKGKQHKKLYGVDISGKFFVHIKRKQGNRSSVYIQTVLKLTPNEVKKYWGGILKR